MVGFKTIPFEDIDGIRFYQTVKKSDISQMP
jgi:hypothetical protein